MARNWNRKQMMCACNRRCSFTRVPASETRCDTIPMWVWVTQATGGVDHTGRCQTKHSVPNVLLKTITSEHLETVTSKD
jgi:hypothetical protein